MDVGAIATAIALLLLFAHSRSLALSLCRSLCVFVGGCVSIKMVINTNHYCNPTTTATTTVYFAELQHRVYFINSDLGILPTTLQMENANSIVYTNTDWMENTAPKIML